MAYVWPTRRFWPQASPVIDMPGRVISSGPTISGAVQVARTDGGGLLVLAFTGIILRTDEEFAAWSAWHAVLDGGVTDVIVPLAGGKNVPRSDGAAGAQHTPASAFPVDTTYTPPSGVGATLHASASAGATLVTLNTTSARQLRGGERFSYDHGGTVGRRAHRVARIVSTTTLGANSYRQQVEVRPPLRGAISSGQAVDFNAPAFLARCAQMTPPPEFGRVAEVAVTFIEAPTA